MKPVGRWGLSLLLVSACRDKAVEERRADVEDLCAEFCDTRVACVPDGHAGGAVTECERKCVGDPRPLEDTACGEASFAALECLAAVACVDLPDAVTAVGGHPDAACYAELRAQQDACELTPLY